MRRIRSALLTMAQLSACAALVACATQSRTNLASNDFSSDERSAARKIAEARCERQAPSCGIEQTRDQCIQRKLIPSAADLDLEDCSSAINEPNLERCVVQIRAGRCGTGIARLTACSHDNICPGQTEEGTI